MQERAAEQSPWLTTSAPSPLQGHRPIIPILKGRGRSTRSCNSRVGYSHRPSGSPAQRKSLKRMARLSFAQPDLTLAYLFV